MSSLFTILKSIRNIIGIMMISFCSFEGFGQESVLDLFKSDLKTAEEYFQQENYRSAINLYLAIANRNDPPADIYLKLARCHYLLNEYAETAANYKKALSLEIQLFKQDSYYYAESLTSIGAYQKASEYYKMYLKEFPQESDLIMNKLWRLDNIHFLLEDSMHAAIRKLPISTDNGEFGLRPYGSGFVFISNAEKIGWVKKLDATNNKSFYQLLYVDKIKDSLHIKPDSFGTPRIFSKSLSHDYHMGTVAFYDEENKMVFSSTEAESQKLHLNFAHKEEDQWLMDASFPYNSFGFSNTDPTINEDGTLLLFSSDRPGGYGKKDIYQSEFINGKWTEPVNLGGIINTIEDEVFPYLQLGSTLYFSSNGHPGLGGLDIFKAEFNDGKWKKVENIGYPINSGFDDFGISIDALNTHGYFSSNRETAAYDDIYEFDMDIQTYPVEVNGLVQYIEHNWMDSSELKVLASVDLYLIDEITGEIVDKTVSDSEGHFSLSVPYFSSYIIRIKGQEMEGMITFEVPKYAKLQGAYHIVAVKDDFKVFADNLRE